MTSLYSRFASNNSHRTGWLFFFAFQTRRYMQSEPDFIEKTLCIAAVTFLTMALVTLYCF